MTPVILTEKLFITLTWHLEFFWFLFWCLLSVFQLPLSSPDRLSPSDLWRSLAGSDQGSRRAMECFFHCMRYSSVQIEQWGGTPSCWNTTVFMLTALLPLNAGMKLLHNMLMHRSESNAARRTSPSSKNYGSKMPLFPTVHHTVVFLRSEVYPCVQGAVQWPKT